MNTINWRPNRGRDLAVSRGRGYRPLRVVASLLTALLSLGLLAPLPAVASGITVTTTTNLNVRSGPSVDSKVVGPLYRGQTVTALSNSGEWTLVSYRSGKSYVASRYLTGGKELPSDAAVGSGTTKKTTAHINLRSGPGLTYKILKVLKKGTTVSLTGKTSRGYTEVRQGSSKGWVSSQYLTSAATGLPAITGTRIATADLAIRTTSGKDSKTVAEVKKGTKLSVTGATQNGRAQIIYKKQIRWVTARYLANPTTTLPIGSPLPKVTGTRYATAPLNIRSTSGDDYRLIAEVPIGTALSITGVIENRRMQIVYLGAARWVTAQYLSTTRPTSSSPAPSYAVERGLKPNAIKVHRAILAEYPQIVTFYGVRADPIPDHPTGRALDCMIPNYRSSEGKALGNSMSRWARANADELGINYIIWDQHIWNKGRDSEGWRVMGNRGGDSANHKDHVHITVYADGYPAV